MGMYRLFHPKRPCTPRRSAGIGIGRQSEAISGPRIPSPPFAPAAWLKQEPFFSKGASLKKR